MSTILADMDFETYSEAGYYWDDHKQRWRGTVPNKSGLGAVGAVKYAEHPSTEVLCLAYNLKDGRGDRLWTPGDPDPHELFEHLASGEVIEAWNSSFEWLIWNYVCVPKLGWPPLDYRQLRCAMSKARAWALPGKLAEAGSVLPTAIQKNPEGERLIKKCSCPRTPTKDNSLLRRTPVSDPEMFQQLYDYCRTDIASEGSISAMIPDLSPEELQLWLLDQQINLTGVHIDTESLDACMDIVEQATEKYTQELQAITGGQVEAITQVAELASWCTEQGVPMSSVAKDVVSMVLKQELPDNVRRVLEIRQLLGGSAVKKLQAIRRQVANDGRLKELFAFCGADRTGRWAGRGPQPQNLPSDTVDDVDTVLETIRTRDLRAVESISGNAVKTVSGCLRGLFCASPGHELVCSDYSAIEAVVLAAIAGEEWRLDVFRTHGKIYEMSASMITGISLEEMDHHKEQTGEKHPARKLGKVAELASGYGGGIGAWKAFGADEFMEDHEIKDNIKKWRDASPNIRNFWYRLEDAAVSAVRNPGQCFLFNGITYGMKDNVLYCQLPSGRFLSYHDPVLYPDVTPWGKETWKLTYMNWNTNYQFGQIGWVETNTWGGKLTENVVQAISRDILAAAMLRIYPYGQIVLHVHDELVVEVLKGTLSVEKLEELMMVRPDWAADWPITAKGGWIGQRYRK